MALSDAGIGTARGALCTLARFAHIGSSGCLSVTPSVSLEQGNPSPCRRRRWSARHASAPREVLGARARGLRWPWCRLVCGVAASSVVKLNPVACALQFVPQFCLQGLLSPSCLK